MSKKIKDNSFKRIIYFPERINTFTTFFIIILYTLILYIIGNSSFKPFNYNVDLEKLNYISGKEVRYEDLNPYVLIRGTLINKNADKEDEELEVDYEMQYRVYASIYTVGTTKPTQIRYFYSLMDKENKTHYLYESSKDGINPTSSTAPNQHVLNHNLIGNSIVVGKDAITKVYIKLRYNNDDHPDKIVKVLEEIIEIKANEISGNLFGESNEIEDILKINFFLRDFSSDRLKAKFDIVFDEIDTPFHLNMQSWLITTTGEIYPFFGLYNYRTPKKYSVSTEADVYKYINAEYIYLKMQYTDNNKKLYSLYYKVAIADLLE